MPVPRLSLFPSLAAFLLLAIVIGASSSSVNDPQFDEFVRLRSAAEDGVIRLSDATFDRLITGSHLRSYGVVLFFDAQRFHDKPSLSQVDLRREFVLAAKSYASNYVKTDDRGASKMNQTVAQNGRHEQDGQEGAHVVPRLFFCDIELDESEATFRSLNLNHVPTVHLFPPGAKTTRAHNMDFEELPHTAEGFADFIQSAAEVDIRPILRPPTILSRLKRHAPVLAAAGVAVMAPVVIRLLLTSWTPLHSPVTWCIGGLAVYFFSVSGGMFNIIRGMPMYIDDYDRPGKFVFFYEDSDAQFGVEGFLLGALYTVVGLLLAFAAYVAPVIKKKWVQRLVLYGLLVAAAAAVRQVVQLNANKTGYSIHGFWPKADS